MEPPFEDEVLHLLREAGEENLATVFNTLRVTHGTELWSEFFERTARAVEGLEKEGEAEFAWYKGRWVPLRAEERSRLRRFSECLVWDASLLRWRWNEAFGPEQPILILTKKGEEHVRSELQRTK